MKRKRPTAQQRRDVSTRANGLCEYCLLPNAYVPQTFAIEHIIPVVLGGETIVENLALSCAGCNGHKYNKTVGTDPITGTQCPLYNPRIHDWDAHFSWGDDGLYLLGVSEIGRATIVTFKLNRQRVVNLRRLLMLDGLHPPNKL